MRLSLLEDNSMSDEDKGVRIFLSGMNGSFRVMCSPDPYENLPHQEYLSRTCEDCKRSYAYGIHGGDKKLCKECLEKSRKADEEWDAEQKEVEVEEEAFHEELEELRRKYPRAYDNWEDRHYDW